MRDVPESDWKLFRQLRELALDRFCQRVLEELEQTASDAGQTPHERYLAIYKLIHERDEELARTFNDARRSTMLIQLSSMHVLKLLTEEELMKFSPETRAAISLLTRPWD